MALTSDWTRSSLKSALESSRTLKSRGHRSLSSALREAGLGDAAPEPTRDKARENVRKSATSAVTSSRSPRLAYFTETEPHPVTPPAGTTHQGVVSPPPWMRAARRGKLERRLMNTFGWTVTLIVAGTIIGLTAHYLAIPMPALEFVQARQ